MLRSTGFFRGLDCPFFTDEIGCNRPYCHFRHSQQRRSSYGAPVDAKRQKDVQFGQKEQGYDPFNPEVVTSQEQQNGDFRGALELVNKAIEEVRNQVEREKRKLSRIGDEPYNPTESASLSSSDVAKSRAAGLHLAYDPGSYQITSGGYNLTPGCSKYTLDSDIQGHNSNSMEYVPTSLKRFLTQTQVLQPPSPPPSPKYSKNASFKYTVDKSRPSTDMEYDPLSNYSAGITAKSKKNEGASIKTDSSKACTASGTVLSNEGCVSALKKPLLPSLDTKKYTISDSDGESSGTEYRPASLSSLQQVESSGTEYRPTSLSSLQQGESSGTEYRPTSLSSLQQGESSGTEYRPTSLSSHQQGESSGTEYRPTSLSSLQQGESSGTEYRPTSLSSLQQGESSGTEYRPTSLSNLQQKKANGSAKEAFRKDMTESFQCALTQKIKEDSGIQEIVKHNDFSDKRKVADPNSHGKSSKSETVHKPEKGTGKSSGQKSSSIRKDKGPMKNSNQVCAKKENKSHGKVEKGKNSTKVKASDKVQRESRDEKRSDGKIKTMEKTKMDSSKQDKEAPESKKLKTSDRGKEHSKPKDRQHKNGKLDRKRDKDVKKTSKPSCSSSKVSSANAKDKVKQNTSSSHKKKLGNKKQSLSLSHTDLFGDESPDEAEPIVVDDVDDDDDDVEEVLVRKSANAVKRGCLNKRKAVERSPSSSEDDLSTECSKTSWERADGAEMDFSRFQDDLDFDSDPMEECLRIFNESKHVKKEDKGRQAKQSSRDSEEEKITDSTLTTLFPGQKKRVSHFVAKGNTEAPSKSVVRPYKRPTPQEMCFQRMQLAQQQAAQLSASVQAAPKSSSLGGSGEKKRIAHRPNPQAASSKTSPAHDKHATSRVLSPSQSLQGVKAQTSAGILSKTSSTVTQKRVAHTPTLKSTSMKRPVIPIEFGAKVPTNIRQRYLNTFIDECVKFCASEEAAFHMALDEEKLVYERSSSKNIYLNVAVNTLKKLRGKSCPSPSPSNKESGSAAKRKPQSHEEVLGGRLAATTSFTVNRSGKQQEERLVGAVLYRKMKAYLMSEEELQEHGYPRLNPEASGKAVIHNLPEKKIILDPFNKICCRCGAEYKVNVKGSCVRKEECSYHWGRLRRHKVAGGWETTYSCCSTAVGAPGCQLAKQHVQDARKESLDGFVSTFSKPLPPDGNGGVFALDCEMCYTKQGLELTRVTVIDSEMKVIYDTFVKPESKVVDYNTRFSGVTEEDLEGVTITLRDVQAVLLCMFRAEAILIGHSLESDLLALKLIHSSVVDTSVVFPHRLGLPYKRALKNLMADYLKRIIQDNVEGHDSSEDASACMELMIWKIKEDTKVKR